MTENLEKKLLQSCKNETFLDEIYALYLGKEGDDGSLSALLVQMHNIGNIDVVAEFRKLKNSDSDGKFFPIRDIFEDILPLINAPVRQVMECVKYLTLQAGNDALYVLMNSFEEFCCGEVERPSQLVSLATKEVDEDFDFLSVAIVSGAKSDIENYVEKSISLVGNENIIISRRAIFALGRIDYNNRHDLIKMALDVIVLKSESVGSEPLLSTILRSLTALFLKDRRCKVSVLAFLKKHQGTENDQLIHVAVEFLAFEKSSLPDEMVGELLKLASQVDAKNKGTLNYLDRFLSKSLEEGGFEKAIAFIENLFEQSDYKISISDFGQLAREIYKSEALTSKLITRWLLSRKAALGRFSFEFFSQNNARGKVVECDLSQLPVGDEDIHLFLAKKSCGWLFSHQISAVSFIVSLVDSTPEKNLKWIADIIFSPLLISYSGSVKKYLEESSEDASDKLKGFVGLVLEKLDRYHSDLESIPRVNELKPSETQRHAYSRFHNRIMSKANEDARQGSIFLSMVKESMILYGNSSIHYIHHDGGKSRQENVMQKVSTSFEFPSLQYIDPHGLDYQVRRFRLEGCIK